MVLRCVIADDNASFVEAAGAVLRREGMEQSTYEFIPYAYGSVALCDPARHQGRPSVARVLHDLVQGRERRVIDVDRYSVEQA